MASQDDFKKMIMSFRVSELQMLLGFAGRNKTGRKTELQTRAMDLLKKRNTSIEVKIAELHRCVTNGSSSSNSLQGHPSYSQEQRFFRSPPPPYTPSIRSAYLGYDYNSYTGMRSQSRYPVHPDVRFKKLPFYEQLGELLKPASLVPRGSSQWQDSSFTFHLTPQQVSDITGSTNSLLDIYRIEYTVQVQLRFCLLETSCEQEDCFPPSLSVKVNNKMCHLPSVIPTNKPGVEPKRPPRPVDITYQCHLNSTMPNILDVSWTSDFACGYAVTIHLVKKLASSELLHALRQRGVRNSDFTKGMIKEKLQEDADSEIATTSLRVSLLCPLGTMLMKEPARATTCTHLQCFDAAFYIQMNEKKASWLCPVCNKPAEFRNLVIDGYFVEVLNSKKLTSHDIELHMDGSWSPHTNKKKKDEESTLIETPVKASSPQVETLSGDDEQPETQSKSKSSPQKSARTEQKSEPVIVDLTETDSDDDDDIPRPTKRRMRSPAILHSDSSSSHSPASSTRSFPSPTQSSTTQSPAPTQSLSSSSNRDCSPDIITLDSPSVSPSPPRRQTTPVATFSPTTSPMSFLRGSSQSSFEPSFFPPPPPGSSSMIRNSSSSFPMDLSTPAVTSSTSGASSSPSLNLGGYYSHPKFDHFNSFLSSRCHPAPPSVFPFSSSSLYPPLTTSSQQGYYTSTSYNSRDSRSSSSSLMRPTSPIFPDIDFFNT